LSLTDDSLVTKMDEESRHRAPKPDWKKISKPTRIDKDEVFDVYEFRLLKGDSRQDVLEDLAKRYKRDVRTIERWISETRKQRLECQELTAKVTVPWGIVKHFDVSLPTDYVWIERFKVVAKEASRFRFQIRAKGGVSIHEEDNILALGTEGMVLEYPEPLIDSRNPIPYRDRDSSKKLHLTISWLDTLYLRKRPSEVEFTIVVWVRPMAGSY